MFLYFLYYSLSENSENVRFPLTRGSWSKSAAVITVRPVNAFSDVLRNISPNVKWISVHNSLDTKESSFIIKTFSSGSLYFLKHLQICHLNQVICSRFNSKTIMNGVSTCTYCWYSCRFKQRDFRFSGSLQW